MRTAYINLSILHDNPCIMRTVWVKKSSPPIMFYNIFTQNEYISVKFCQYIASAYPHMLNSFGRFILIFNKIVVNFSTGTYRFTVSAFEFPQVELPRLYHYWWVASIHPTSIDWLWGLGAKTAPEFKLHFS